MQFVYATGQPRNMEFAVASRQDRVPSGATVYATLYRGGKAVENLDEHTFNAMSDEEFYTFRSLIQDARRDEAQGGDEFIPRPVRKIFRWLGLC